MPSASERNCAQYQLTLTSHRDTPLHRACTLAVPCNSPLLFASSPRLQTSCSLMLTTRPPKRARSAPPARGATCKLCPVGQYTPLDGLPDQIEITATTASPAPRALWR